MSDLSEVVDSYMERTEGLKRFCDGYLKTERHDGNVVLMGVDAVFDSIGLNYFNLIVPKVLEFEERFVKDGRVQSLDDLGNLPPRKWRTYGLTKGPGTCLPRWLPISMGLAKVEG